MKTDREPTENPNLASSLAPVWQGLWHGRVRITIFFLTFLTLLLWLEPSARSYDLLYTVLIAVSTLVPLVYLTHALLRGEGPSSDSELLDSGMMRIDLVDHRNLMPLAALCITLVVIGVILLQVFALRATLQNPLPLAPGRWMAALGTSVAMTMLCHLGLVSIDFG